MLLSVNENANLVYRLRCPKLQCLKTHLGLYLTVSMNNLSSPYYVQMLGQMAVENFSFCDSVLYTKKDMLKEFTILMQIGSHCQIV